MMEEEMPDTGGAPKPGGAGWQIPYMVLPGQPASAHVHMTRQMAESSLVILDLFESWLTASRQTFDLWRTMVREIQDGAMATYRQEVVSRYAHDLLEEMEIPATADAKRPGGKAARIRD